MEKPIRFCAQVAFVFFASKIFTIVNVRADEPIAEAQDLLAHGYHPLTTLASPMRTFRILTDNDLPKNLPWPVAFADTHHTIGNSMLQYQSYVFGESYFHGGCDLRTQAHGEVHAPVSGRVAGNHYSYAVQPDGSLAKYVMPWPQEGQEAYFEISITTPAGFRFEMHHVDRETLNPQIKTLLDQGGGDIAAGTLIGNSFFWTSEGVDGELYHHIHYNIFTPEGVALNPEAYAPAITDTTAPIVHGIFGVNETGLVSEPSIQGSDLPLAGLKEVVVATTDQKDGSVYTEPPVKVQLLYPDGSHSGWDFSQHLRNENEKAFPSIFTFYVKQITTPDGQTLRTQGNYQNNFFLIRIPVKAGESSAKIVIQDQAGNQAILPTPAH